MFRTGKLVSAVTLMVALAPLAAQAKWADMNQKHDNAILVTTPSPSKVPSAQPPRLSERATPGNAMLVVLNFVNQTPAPSYAVSAEAQSGEGG
jgi:hypothetical protein